MAETRFGEDLLSSPIAEMGRIAIGGTCLATVLDELLERVARLEGKSNTGAESPSGSELEPTARRPGRPPKKVVSVDQGSTAKADTDLEVV